MRGYSKASASLAVVLLLGLGGWQSQDGPQADSPPDPKSSPLVPAEQTPGASSPSSEPGFGVMGKSYRREEMNTEEFVFPIDQRDIPKEEWKRIMDAPGVKFVRRGPKGSPFYEQGFIVEPYDDHKFHPWVALNRSSTPEEFELAEEVRRKLEAERPENPGRENSFPKWVTIKTPEQPSIPLVHSGWSLGIRGVEEIPGGWRARVEVTPYARTEFYEYARIFDFHVEIYACKDGKLTLEKEYPNPRRPFDPMKGLRATIRDR